MNPEFQKATEQARILSSSLSNDDALFLYSRYKQATVGDCNTDRPGFLDFTGRAKWDAWNAIKNKSKESYQNEYIHRVSDLTNST